MKLYNTLTRRKEEFVPIEKNKVTMYSCGPTVYNFIHVGNARPLIMFDVLRRYFEYRGYEVTFVQNFTDVDDKIIRRANEMNVDPFDLAEGYIQDFEKNMAELNILPATVNPRASHEIDQIIEMVEGLIEKGYAYPLEGDVYFRVRKDPDYEKLSGRNFLPPGCSSSGKRISGRSTWPSVQSGISYWEIWYAFGRSG